MRLASIHTYPVKGAHRADQATAEVKPWGLAGDRRWMLVDEDGVGVTQRELPALATVHPGARVGGLAVRADGMPVLDLAEPVAGATIEVRVFSHRAPVLAELAGQTADEWFSTVLDRKVRLVWLGDPTRRAVNPDYGKPGDRVSFADGYPLLATSAASLDALNGWLRADGDAEGPLPMTRFRPNVVVADAEPWAEDGWLGRRIRIGNVVFRAVKSCGRCVVTTTDQETGELGHQPLRMLAQRRNVDQKLLFGTYLIPDTTGPIAVGDPVELLPRIDDGSRPRWAAAA